MEYDKFVEHVIKDPSNPEDLRLITGFVGPGANRELCRVYPDINLSSFVEILIEHVRAQTPIPREISPMGGFHLWVLSEAEITYCYDGQQFKARIGLLDGELCDSLLPRAMAQKYEEAQAKVEAIAPPRVERARDLYYVDALKNMLGGSPIHCHMQPGTGATLPGPGTQATFCEENTCAPCITTPLCDPDKRFPHRGFWPPWQGHK